MILNKNNIIRKFKLNKINQIKINLTSPEKIKNWTKREQLTNFFLFDKKEPQKFSFKRSIFGELKNPTITETPSSTKFSKQGLFCEQIFGPLKDFKCGCSDKQFVKQNIFKECNVCNVTYTLTKIRSYRMGYIPLPFPIFNSLFFLGTLNLTQNILSLSKSNFINLIYLNIPKQDFTDYTKLFEKLLDTKEDVKSLNPTQDSVLVEQLKKNVKTLTKDLKFLLKEFDIFLKRYLLLFYNDSSKVELFNEKIYNFLDSYDFLKEIRLIKILLNKHKINDYKYQQLIRKYRILNNLYTTKAKLSWLMLKALPVIPVNFRPHNAEDDDSSKASKINELYQNILRINIRIQKAKNFNIERKKYLILNELRLLQESVDFLLDHEKSGKNNNINDKPSKSLADLIKGKEGRFRKNILGKRINFSARSVIVVDPFLNLNQCAIPFNILKNLFSSKIENIINKMKNSKNFSINDNSIFEFKILKSLLKHEIVMLNRAPTLHKLGIQSFDILITNDDAIHLHPLVCSPYNADFDGDQMAVYIPLTKLSFLELKFLLKATKEFFLFGNSNLKMKPSQELILGLNYLSLKNEKVKHHSFGHYFYTYDDFFENFIRKKLFLHNPVWIKQNNSHFNKITKPSVEKNNFIRITPGRLILSNLLDKKK